MTLFNVGLVGFILTVIAMFAVVIYDKIEGISYNTFSFLLLILQILMWIFIFMTIFYLILL